MECYKVRSSQRRSQARVHAQRSRYGELVCKNVDITLKLNMFFICPCQSHHCYGDTKGFTMNALTLLSFHSMAPAPPRGRPNLCVLFSFHKMETLLTRRLFLFCFVRPAASSLWQRPPGRYYSGSNEPAQ